MKDVVYTKPIKNPDFLDKMDKILLCYRKEVRETLYIIVNVQPKPKKLPMFFVNEIRALNDHIARCFIEEKDDNQIIKELGKAEGHLTRLRYDVYKQMNALLYDKTIGVIEKKAYEQMDGWYDDSWASFREQYYRLKREAAESVQKAKFSESRGEVVDKVVPWYKQGFDKYSDLEQLVIDKKKDFLDLEKANNKNFRLMSRMIQSSLFQIVLAIITTIISYIITHIIIKWSFVNK